MLRKNFQKIIKFSSKKPSKHKDVEIPFEIQGVHDCGLRALYMVLPHLSILKMKKAFGSCCEWWPYRGISNKEFNITLSHLKVRDQFDYISCDDNTNIGDLINHKENTFIALIWGHYIVINKGICLERLPEDTKIYCYWVLK